MTEIQQFNPSTGQLAEHGAPPVTTADTISLMAWAGEMQAAGQLASALCQTQFVPDNFKGKEGDTAAAIMMGKSLGMDPLNALQNLFVVRGKPGMYARTMHSLVLRAGHEVERVEATEQRVTWRARRRGTNTWQSFTWDTARATKAGYVGTNQKYKTDPIGMLSAKALAEACRTVAPDVLTGVAAVTVEEIQLGDFEDAEIVDNTPAKAVEAPKRTVKRKAAPAPAPAPEPPAAVTTEHVEPEHAGDTNPDEDLDQAPAPSTRSQWIRLGNALDAVGITDKADKTEAMRSWAKDQGITTEITSAKDLTGDQVEALIVELESDPEADTDDTPVGDWDTAGVGQS